MTLNKKEFLLALIIVVMFIIGLYLYPIAPKRMPIHWNSKGLVDGYGTRFTGLFLMPIIVSFVYIILLMIPRIAIYKGNIKRFQKHFFSFKLILVLFFFVLYIFTIIQAFGHNFNMNFFIVPAISILLYFIGNFLRFTKRNYFIGIRTPWTLASEKVWNKTHTLGSKLFKLVAIFCFFGVFFKGYSIFFILIPVVIVAVFLIVYSYLIYQEELIRR